MEEMKFALDTFYAIMSGALVMWMAAGFTMLEAGLVQKKDVSEIVTKNLGLFSIACVMYLVCCFGVALQSSRSSRDVDGGAGLEGGPGAGLAAHGAGHRVRSFGLFGGFYVHKDAPSDRVDMLIHVSSRRAG